jgi:hypothetical protein
MPTIGVIAMATTLLVGLLLVLSASAVAEPTEAGKLITDSAQVEQHTRDFERSLELLGIRWRLQCQKMIELTPESRDRSYGAICELQNLEHPRTIMLCDDVLLGKLTIKGYGFSVSDDEVIEFTRLNCPAGG